VCTPDAQATSLLPAADPKDPDWVVEYGYTNGFPTQLFVVPGGDVVAVGYQDSASSLTYGDEAALIKRLNPAGAVVWSLRFNGVTTRAAALDPAGFLYVAGVRGYDYSYPPGDIGTAVLIKIDLAGNLVWERLMPGADGYTVFRAVSIDPSGRAVVSATERMSVSDWRCVVRQYAGNGDINWTRVIQKAGLTYNTDLGMDVIGNVYVTVEAGGFPHWLMKFTANNDSLWAVTDTTANSMSVLGDRVYLNGSGALSCYTTNGVRLWTLSGLALLDVGADYLLVREGGLLQLRSIDGTPFWSVDTGLEVNGGVLIPERGVFITGYFNCCGNRAAFTAKLTLGGVPVWAQTPYQSPGGDSNYGSAVRVDASSADHTYIYVIGKAYSPQAGITVTKLSEATVSALVARFTAEVVSEGIRLRWRFGSAIVGHGTIERADRATGPWTMPTMETQLDGDGYSAIDGTVEAGRTYHYRLVVDEDGHVVTLAEISVMAGRPLSQAALLGVSPAPSEGRTAIDFVLSREELASLKVFDIHGRTEAELVNEVLPAGRHRAVWSGENERGRSPAGVYFVRLEAEGRTFTQRIVIAR